VRILVTGSRTWDDPDYIWQVLDGLLAEAGEMVLHHGACKLGADQAAHFWALRKHREGQKVLVVKHPARWRRSDGSTDKSAGFRRNAEMVTAVVHADLAQTAVCHAFIRGNSPGATHCANTAEKAGIPVVRHRWEDR
jgi:hypothetical protein